MKGLEVQKNAPTFEPQEIIKYGLIIIKVEHGLFYIKNACGTYVESWV